MKIKITYKCKYLIYICYAYNQWARDNNIVVNSNATSFGIQFRKIKIPHIKRRGKKGNIILFIINEVKENVQRI